jgi:hypothetical protein
MLIAERLSYLEQNHLAPVMDLAARVGRMLNGLTRALNQKLTSDPRPPAPGPRSDD